MKRYSLLIILAVFCFETFSQQRRWEVSFQKDDREIMLEDDFQLYLISFDSTGKFIFKPHIINNFFCVPPDFPLQDPVTFVFKYKGDFLYTSTFLNYPVDSKIIFGLDKKPFSKEYILGEGMESLISETKYIVYLKGEFTVTSFCVVDKKKFRKYIEELLE